MDISDEEVNINGLGVVLYDRGIFIFSQFSSYNFYRGPMEYTIYLQNFLI